MSDCPSDDVLVGISEATRGYGLRALDHLADCAECRATLGDLEALRTVAASVTPDPGFDDRVFATIERLQPPEEVVASRHSIARQPIVDPRTMVGILAAGCTLLVLAFTSWSQSADASLPLPLLGGASVVAGALAARRTRLA